MNSQNLKEGQFDIILNEILVQALPISLKKITGARGDSWIYNSNENALNMPINLRISRWNNKFRGMIRTPERLLELRWIKGDHYAVIEVDPNALIAESDPAQAARP